MCKYRGGEKNTNYYAFWEYQTEMRRWNKFKNH